MNWCRLTAVTIAGALLSNTPALAYDQYFPFKSEPPTILERALSPAEQDVNFVINEVPVGYRQNRDLDLDKIETRLKSAEALLTQSSSRTAWIPTGFERECPIGIQSKALQLLNEPGLSVKQDGYMVRFYFTPGVMQNGSDNKDLAAVFDALAVVKMRQNELQNAEKYLLDGLRQKIMLVGPGSPHLLPNLDYLCSSLSSCAVSLV